jgi:hypothetical protein
MVDACEDVRILELRARVEDGDDSIRPAAPTLPNTM